MNCEQILHDQIHEKYVQGELSTPEMEAYEAHLESCAICSAGLEQERQLIQGIQSAAKDAMKFEIMQQTETLRPLKKKIDWTVVYKAAAVFLIVALLPGIVYYYNNIEAPQGIDSWQISDRIEKPVSAQVLEEEKQDSNIESISSDGLATVGKGISSTKRSEKVISTLPEIPKAQQEGSLGKQVVPAPVKRKAKKASSPSRLITDDQDIFESKSVEPLSVTSERRQDAQNRAQARSRENAPVQLIEALASEKQPSVQRYSFVPTVVYSRSKALSKGFEDPGYYKSRDGKIKLKVVIEEGTENKLIYQVKNRSENLLEMNWTFWMPSGTISFSELQYEIKQDSLLQLFRHDSLLYELNLNKLQGNANYIGNK